MVIVIVVIVSWLVANTIGWWAYRTAEYAPFNWRVYVLPSVYVNWARRKARQ